MISLPRRKMRTTAFAVVALLLSCHIFAGFCAMVPTAIADTPAAVQAAPYQMEMSEGCPDSLVNAAQRDMSYGEPVAMLLDLDRPPLSNPRVLVSKHSASQTCTPLHGPLLLVLRI